MEQEQSAISKTIAEAIEKEQWRIEWHLKELEVAIIRKKALEAGAANIDQATTATEIANSIEAFNK